jgi:rubredoxin
MYGETSIGRMAQARKRRSLHHRIYPVVCGCGAETKVSEHGLRNMPHGWKCRDCKAKAKKEWDQTLLNLAKNKKKLAAKR